MPPNHILRTNLGKIKQDSVKDWINLIRLEYTRTVSKMPVHARIELEFGVVGFWEEGKTGVPGKKTSQSREENQQQTQPTDDSRSENRTRDTLVGGERTAPSLLRCNIQQRPGNRRGCCIYCCVRSSCPYSRARQFHWRANNSRFFFAMTVINPFLLCRICKLSIYLQRRAFSVKKEIVCSVGLPLILSTDYLADGVESILRHCQSSNRAATRSLGRWTQQTSAFYYFEMFEAR